MRDEEKVCHYLDLPIQHASDAVLKRMGRRTTQADIKEIVAKLRKEIPDIVLRTTLIAGFPGETQEQHEEMIELQQEIAFDKAQDREGSIVTAMVEGKVADENAYVARTYGDAPNVDGLLFIQTAEELNSGDFARVRITGSAEYDLIGELAD